MSAITITDLELLERLEWAVTQIPTPAAGTPERAELEKCYEVIDDARGRAKKKNA